MNTIIITEENRGINSMDYWGYALKPFSNVEDESGDTIYSCTLVACFGIGLDEPDNSENTVISTFHGSEFGEVSREACQALESLLDAVNDGEGVWNVHEHNSNL